MYFEGIPSLCMLLCRTIFYTIVLSFTYITIIYPQHSVALAPQASKTNLLMKQ